jgi:hypothetical protein
MSATESGRPSGVTFVGGLAFVAGIADLLLGLLLFLQIGNEELVARFGGTVIMIVFAVSVMIVGLVILLVAGGLFNGSRGARVTEVIFQAYSIVVAVWVSIAAPSLLWAALISLVVSVAVIVLLFTGRANAYFRA